MLCCCYCGCGLYIHYFIHQSLFKLFLHSTFKSECDWPTGTSCGTRPITENLQSLPSTGNAGPVKRCTCPGISTELFGHILYAKYLHSEHSTIGFTSMSWTTVYLLPFIKNKILEKISFFFIFGVISDTLSGGFDGLYRTSKKWIAPSL